MRERLEEDIKEIKDIMNRSTRFTSLSGLSGVAAGVTGLSGALAAWWFLFRGRGYLEHDIPMNTPHLKRLLAVAVGTLVAAAVTAIFFTVRKAKGANVWNAQARRFVINLAIPMTAGGLVCLFMLYKGMTGYALPLSLIFYGLALVNASRDTLREIRTLGLLETALGLLALPLMEYGLLFWALGFGVLHIVFGIMVQWKYRP